MFGFLFGLAALVAYRALFGAAVDRVITGKGYEEIWFWWGFFFGFLALLVALAKADASGGARPPEDRKEALLQEGGWICQRCGQVNPAYTGTCGCGAAKRDRGAPEAEAQREARELAHAQSLKAYKELLDAGALTQEEFDRKKAELLGL